MAKPKKGKTFPYIPSLFAFKRRRGYGGQVPHRCVLGDLSPKRGRRLKA